MYQLLNGSSTLSISFQGIRWTGLCPDKATVFQDGQGPDAALSGQSPVHLIPHGKAGQDGQGPA